MTTESHNACDASQATTGGSNAKGDPRTGLNDLLTFT
jgi:hypothetical protein